MRFGTICSGSTMFARTGARTTWSASASFRSFSVSGSTSQNVSVMSNGVCAIAQKFAYVRGCVVRVVRDDGEVDLLGVGHEDALDDGVSVLPHHADDHALHLHLIGGDDDRLHRRVRRLQADAGRSRGRTS